ncbi:pyridoxal phosphate-dependent aminotransferase [Prochlorococcus marinus]|uniref:pyridoxal phosphate-dependent aminotransferase n=1 Tax=Prochlorococcus marinus TaxID=1219 RepID=UPI0022B5B56D|nr:aminotransferase class I/II-fold pyridoxal phosphate-dependent enzyme [Prochlorococcus marinus]
MDLKANQYNNSLSAYMLQHGGNLEEEAKNLGVDINSLIDASASIVPFSLPSKLHRHLHEAIDSQIIRSYPDRNHNDIREALGRYHQVCPTMILPGNGASELITWAAHEASIHGISILPYPGFYDYKRALDCWGGKYIQKPLPLHWDKEYPKPFPWATKAKVLWITNPHNPTGHFWSRQSIEELLKNNSLIICDEAFLPLVPNGDKESLIPLVKHYPNLIVLRSLTKLFAIAGLRIGYAISSEERLWRWQALRDPWPVNGLSISIIKVLMNEKQILTKRIKKVHHWVRKEGEWLHENLQKIPGIISHPSSTNFQLIESYKSLSKLREQLGYKNILVRDCRSFKGLGENWLRISLQSKSNNRRIVDTMKKIITHSL